MDGLILSGLLRELGRGGTQWNEGTLSCLIGEFRRGVLSEMGGGGGQIVVYVESLEEGHSVECASPTSVVCF